MGQKDFFKKNLALSCTIRHEPLTLCWVSEKINEPIPRKLTDKQKDGRTDGQTVSYRTLPATVGGPIGPLYFFSSNVCFAKPIRVQIFKTFKCSGQNSSNSSCQFWNNKSISGQILHHSSVSWKITPLYFLGETLYTSHKRKQLKRKFWEFWILKSKFAEFLSFLKQQISFSSNFASLLSVMRYVLYTFLAKILYTFNKSSLSKYKFGEISHEQLKV